MRRLFAPTLLLLALTACESKAPVAPVAHASAAASTASYIEAAERLTARYAQSPMANWNVRVSAAGAGCDVLLVDSGIVMEASMVDAIHYGVAAYDFLPGGVKQFGRANTFRGVAYRDATGFFWKYGNVKTEELQALKPCR